MSAEVTTEPRTHAGFLASGSRYAIEVPRQWNGVLLLYSKPVPVAAGEPPWEPDEALIAHLVRTGYAVAGVANTIFWPLEGAFRDLPDVLDIARGVLGTPRHTIALGLSIGGVVAAGLVQRFPQRLSGALPMCANLAGAVAIHNRELDISFVAKTLLAPESALRVTGITDPHANLELATAMLHEAQATPAGRARLALAAAMGDIPGWHAPTTAEPGPDEFAARQRNQFAWFEEVSFLVFFFVRRQVEMQAGGNPSWNTEVDYRSRLASSITRRDVEALYASAALDLEDDLERLADAERVEADPPAVAYLERHIVFNGDLGGVPVLSVHTDGDGLVTPGNPRAYAEVVEHAGEPELLRQLYVHRGGHCTFTFAETLTALDVLIARIEKGMWPGLAPEALNAAANRWGADSNRLAPGCERTDPGFVVFDPPPFARRYDARDARDARAESTLTR